MVATSDYGDFHKLVKRYVMTGMLGTSGQVLVTITFDIIHSYNINTCSWVQIIISINQGSKNVVTAQISETISKHQKHDGW
jgi:hypothetical protein